MQSPAPQTRFRIRAMPVAVILAAVALASGLVARHRARTHTPRLGHGVWPPVPSAPANRD